jgi:hypothetical protein
MNDKEHSEYMYGKYGVCIVCGTARVTRAQMLSSQAKTIFGNWPDRQPPAICAACEVLKLQARYYAAEVARIDNAIRTRTPNCK